MYYRVLFFLLLCNASVLGGHPKNLAWNGGPLHLNCEHGLDVWTKTGHYVKDNVIAIKAVTHKDDIFVVTPRMKRDVLATVWLLVRGSHKVELQPFPELRQHKIYDCSAIQNAVDFYLDHLGVLWALDSGVVDTVESPRCTCPPKVVAISIVLNKMVRNIDLSSLAEPTSILQNVIIEYGISGKPFIYVSDASRGAILVHDSSTGSEWSVVACAPAPSLQFALVKRGLAHSVIIIRQQHPAIVELDTAALKRKNSASPLIVYGEHSKPVVLLGSDLHHIYLRHIECSDVLSWDTREAYNSSKFKNIHSAGPRLTSTSVSADPLKHVVLVLDSNYADTVYTKEPTYHRITFIDKL